MAGFAREHLRPLFGSAALHVALLGLLLGAAFNWRSQPPSVPLAIEGTVVQYKDLPPSLRSGKPIREPVPPATPAPRPERPTQEDERRKLEQERAAIEQRRAEARERKARDEAAAEKRRAEQAALKTKAAEDAERKAAADASRREAEAQRARAQAQAADEKAAADRAASEARRKAAREAELRRAMAAEEEGEAIARSGVTDEYRALLVQAIERNWIRPSSARAGLECTLNVTQATGGTVIDVQVGACNGDQAVRESITNAVYKSSPLPAPRDPRAFERRLVIVFKPTE